jgi:hypothetical protein
MSRVSGGGGSFSGRGSFVRVLGRWGGTRACRAAVPLGAGEEIEILLLRHQLRVLERQVARPALAPRWTSRKGYGSRALVGACLVKSMYAIPTWSRTAALVAEHQALRSPRGTDSDTTLTRARVRARVGVGCCRS